jgi:hypothetical protein
MPTSGAGGAGGLSLPHATRSKQPNTLLSTLPSLMIEIMFVVASSGSVTCAAVA